MKFDSEPIDKILILLHPAAPASTSSREFAALPWLPPDQKVALTFSSCHCLSLINALTVLYWQLLGFLVQINPFLFPSTHVSVHICVHFPSLTLVYLYIYLTVLRILFQNQGDNGLQFA
ncbi:hypothetical protein ACH5RR_007087 [Cinchona calisaya]|uniref:Uncharacterized protein n=1 Tax=Cinchona calisaya TaxID=153742 RepID=A0ABD3AQU2_9GENT